MLFSGPQEAPEAAGWVHLAAGDGVLRRAVYARGEECGDVPILNTDYCATQFPLLMRKTLKKMGLERGLLGGYSGYVIVDF